MNGRISFILGSSFWIWDFRKFSHCQLTYHYQYGCCSGPYCEHLVGGSGYSGGRCSWGWGGRNGLGNYPHLIFSLGKHGSSFLVIFLGSWDLSGHGVIILGTSTGAWLQLGWSQLGLLQLGLGLEPGFGTKLTL